MKREGIELGPNKMNTKHILAAALGLLVIVASTHFFIQYKDGEAARAQGYRSYSEMVKSIESGFKDSAEYFDALEKGFSDKVSYAEASKQGLDSVEYLKFKKGGFASKDEYQKALAFGLEDGSQYRAAIAGGFTSVGEFLEASQKGFSNIAMFRKSVAMGIDNFSDYQSAIAQGYPSGKALAEGRSGDFQNYAEYQAAKSVGVRTRKALLEFLDGNKSIEKCADGMTLEKQICKQEKLGKRLFFRGQIVNVSTENEALVRLHTAEGNFADVKFRNPIGRTLSKDQGVNFWGVLKFVGTGIITNHQISDVVLDP